MPAPNNELNTLLAPRFLFRFAAPIKRHAPIWSSAGVVLGETHRLPDLASLDRGTPSAERRFADVRAAWAPEGLAITATVAGKSQAPWCRESRLDESDGLQVWIDTRATLNIHRASRYCHRFGFIPTGGGRGAAEAAADQLLINRARENARPVRPRELQALGRVKPDGYHLMAFIPASALGGYDPEQHTRLGFHYEVVDRELGVQSYANGREFPVDEDPSCWAVLEMV